MDRRTAIRTVGLGVLSGFSGCADGGGTATPTNSNSSLASTDVRLESRFVDLTVASTERSIWLLPTANRTAFSTALEQESFTARIITNLPEYEYTALRENDTALFPHGGIGQVRVDETAYDMFALSTPAVRRYIWYDSADSSTATPFEAFTPAERSFLRDLFGLEANGRENRIERVTGEAVVTALSDRTVSYEGDRYTVRSEYIETPDWPPSGAYVGYKLKDSDASEGRTLHPSPPVPDAFLTDALTDGVTVNTDDERFQAIREADPVLLSLTSAWELRW